MLYLYAWTFVMAGTAVALRFIPYSERSGELNPGWAVLMGALLALCVALSLYLVWVLEILKFRRVRGWQLRRADPDTSEHDIDEQVDHELETGEFRVQGSNLNCAANRTSANRDRLVPFLSTRSIHRRCPGEVSRTVMKIDAIFLGSVASCPRRRSPSRLRPARVRTIDRRSRAVHLPPATSSK